MAFFGLTALGVDSPFEGEYKSLFSVALFEQSEFAAHFTAKGKKSLSCTEEIPTVFRAIFHGPVPEPEGSRIQAAMEAWQEKTGQTTMDLSAFLGFVEELKGEMRATVDRGSEVGAW